jgi:hypothetical protein
MSVSPQLSFDLEHWDDAADWAFMTDSFQLGINFRRTVPLSDARAAFLRVGLSLAQP